MARWRLLLVVLGVLALILWGVLFAINLRPELGHELPPGLGQPSQNLRLQAPLSHLPGWTASLGLFITLFLAGVGSLFLFPVRIRSMSRTLSLGWSRVIVTGLLGIGFGLLIMFFAIAAALARVTFPFTILAALSTMFVAVWGFVTVAYALGRLLLSRAGWGRRSPIWGLALGLLLLLPLTRIPYMGGVVTAIYAALGLGLAVTTRFGSNEPWSLIPLLEEVNE